MKLQITLAALAGLLACSGAFAQAASAPAPGMGTGGMGMGGMHGWRMSRDNTSGWSMMTEAERKAHQEKMRSMTDHGACSAYMQEHHAQMTARAKDRGATLPAMPRRDNCASLKK
jgi:hypothetical protein